MEAISFDIMELIGREVQIVRETTKNKATFSNVMNDVNFMVENNLEAGSHTTGIYQTGLKNLDDRNFSITGIFMNYYCLDSESAPFIPHRMYQLPDDEHPDDYWGGETCIIHPDHD